MKPMRLVLAALLLLALLPRPASALFHFSVIDEVMTSYEGDPNVQFVEIRMLSGSYEGDLLVVDAEVANASAGTRWIMGTTA